MEDMHEAYAEQLLHIITDDVRVVSKHALTLLILGTFIAVTIASTTDEMLIRGNSIIKLPLLSVEVPIRGVLGFYVLAPLMLLAMHCAVLLVLSLLGYRLMLFQEEIKNILPQQREHFCTRLPSFYAVQFLAGQTPEKPLRWLSRVVTWLAILLPLGLLLWIQGRFLPVHDPWTTGFHMGFVIIDAGLICWFWRYLPGHRNRQNEHSLWRRVWQLLVSLAIFLLTFLLTCFSVGFFWAVVTIADQKTGIDPWRNQRDEKHNLTLLERIWEEGLTLFYAVRDLNLREKVLTANDLPAEIINDLFDDSIKRQEAVLNKISPLTFLQGRDLRYANFFHAILPRLDLRAQCNEAHSAQCDEARKGQHDDTPYIRFTKLQGADLRWAQMQQVLLDDANLQGTHLENAWVQGGVLLRVRMQGANLTQAQLQEAKLGGAQLQGVCACEAKLNGADLADAQLEGATLKKVDLRGASLQRANLREANLSNADLQGADLSNADLRYAILHGARLQGAVLRDTHIAGADFSGADLDLADVSTIESGDRIAPKYGASCPCLKEERPDALAEQSPPDYNNPFVGANFWRCRAKQVDQFKQCTPIGDYDYQKLLTQHLVELACADPYIARGLSEQVLHERRADHCLAKVLLASECPSVQLLPERVKRALNDLVDHPGLGVCISDSPDSSP
jgi:uncharacterized protein YjbI with pentapeptide repeats